MELNCAPTVHKTNVFTTVRDSFKRKADSPIYWKHWQLALREGAVRVGFGAPKAGAIPGFATPRLTERSAFTAECGFVYGFQKSNCATTVQQPICKKSACRSCKSLEFLILQTSMYQRKLRTHGNHDNRYKGIRLLPTADSGVNLFGSGLSREQECYVRNIVIEGAPASVWVTCRRYSRICAGHPTPSWFVAMPMHIIFLHAALSNSSGRQLLQILFEKLGERREPKIEAWGRLCAALDAAPSGISPLAATRSWPPERTPSWTCGHRFSDMP